MNAVAILNIINAATSLLSTVLNAVGNSKVVSDIIAKRLAEGGRDWTPEERKQVTDALDKARADADAATKP